MAGPLRLEFLRSAERRDTLPPARAEIALLGRSNVGKSSLLNALAGQRSLAKTSKTPGRTRLLNCFALSEGLHVVDCPGYGYAAAAGAQRAGWQRMMEGYLEGREELRLALVLVDGEIGPTPLDEQMLEWLDAKEIPYRVIATKHDKVKSSKRPQRKRQLAEGCGLEPGDVLWVSAAKGTGVEAVRDLVRGTLLAT